jgi:transposase, IS5 family
LEEFGNLTDESTILRFRHRLEKHKLAEEMLASVNELLTSKGLLLKAGTVVDATLIAAPSSTKNKAHQRDPDIHSSKKGEQMYFGMKAHIGADADSGLVHTVRGTSGNVHDVVEGNSLLRRLHSGMRATRALRGAQMPKHKLLGTLPCVRASAAR